MISAPQIEKIASTFHGGLGSPPKVSTAELVVASVYHEMMGEGTKAEHLKEVTGKEIRDPSLAERYGGMDERVFLTVLDEFLKPQANRLTDPCAFYKGMRLVGIDGGSFSLPNTEAVAAEVEKAATRRGKAAFAKLEICVVSELGLHHPIAASIGIDSEMGLARSLFSKIAAHSLCLGDRYYGNGRCISQFMELCQEERRDFLFRVKEDLKARVVRRLADGSGWVEVCSSDGRKTLVREIRGKVRGRNGKRIRVRFWTSLMNARAHPARQLLELYSMRWEQEIGFDELKNKLHNGNLLKSHTVHTGIQEVAALIMAQSLVAQVRCQVAHADEVPTLRVSFRKVRRYLRAFWMWVEAGGDILTAEQIKRMGLRFRDLLLKQLTSPRRKRSCPRAVRQPIRGWPRLQKNVSYYGDFCYEITPV